MQRKYRLAVVLGLAVLMAVLPVYPVTREECGGFVREGVTPDCSNEYVLHPATTVVWHGFEYDSRALGRTVMDASVTYDASPGGLLGVASVPLVAWVAMEKLASGSR